MGEKMADQNRNMIVSWCKCLARMPRILVCVIVIIAAYAFICWCSLFVRVYTLAYFGNSEAMYILGRDYQTDPPKIVLFSDQQIGYNWIIRSAKKGNEHAIKILVSTWQILDKPQVVYWLKYGVGFDRPWCAEELSRAYEFGLYGLKRDPVKSTEYQAIGDRLRAEGKGDKWDH